MSTNGIRVRVKPLTLCWLHKLTQACCRIFSSPNVFLQVCEVYTLHRETFYLAADYIDRYLTKTTNIHKTRLQLVGITALFIAAKLEVRKREQIIVTVFSCFVAETLEHLEMFAEKWNRMASRTRNTWDGHHSYNLQYQKPSRGGQQFLPEQTTIAEKMFVSSPRCLELASWRQFVFGLDLTSTTVIVCLWNCSWRAFSKHCFSFHYFTRKLLHAIYKTEDA